MKSGPEIPSDTNEALDKYQVEAAIGIALANKIERAQADPTIAQKKDTISVRRLALLTALSVATTFGSTQLLREVGMGNSGGTAERCEGYSEIARETRGPDYPEDLRKRISDSAAEICNKLVFNTYFE